LEAGPDLQTKKKSKKRKKKRDKIAKFVVATNWPVTSRTVARLLPSYLFFLSKLVLAFHKRAAKDNGRRFFFFLASSTRTTGSIAG
jgi:hypothetical protein